MPELIYPDGRPLRRAELTKEIAGPTLTGVRQVMTDHPAQGLTPGRLGSILREAEDGDPTRYLELAEDMEEKDPHYRSVLSTRKMQVSQLEISIEPASDSAADVANAELVESFLQRDELQEELCDILDAVGKGFSVTEMIWETSERQWMPTRLEWRYPQWFEFDRLDGRTPLLRGEAGPEPLAPFKFICHVHKSKSGLPIRGGLARIAAWIYLFKNYDIKDWVAFAEVYGLPLRVGKYHAGATEDEKAVLLKAVANIGTDAAAIIPDSMMLEFVESKMTGNVDLFERLAEYLDKQVSKAVLGQTLTTEVKEGSRAAAQVHDGVRADIERSDAAQASATLNRDLVRPIVVLNNGPQKQYPRLRIGRPEQVDVSALSEALAKLVPIGLKVSQTETRRKIGMGEPDDDSDLLVPPAPPPPDAGSKDNPEDSETDKAAAQRDRPLDSLEALAVEAGADWRPLVGPVADAIMAAAEESADFDEFRDRLAEISQSADAGAAREIVARADFAAAMAGRLGIDVER